MAKESGLSKLEYLVTLLGSEGWVKNRETREGVKVLCLADHATLREGRPGDWVAVGVDGVVAFGKTRREALDGAHSLGLDVRGAASERLNSEYPRGAIRDERIRPSILEKSVQNRKGDQGDDRECLTKMFGPDGSLRKSRENREVREKARRRYLDEQASLLKERPREWVAMGVEGVIAFGNTLEEARDEAESCGFDKTNMVVEFLNPEPFDIPPTLGP